MIKKRLVSSGLWALIGIVLVIAGGVAFLNSLGSGGGFFATALIVSGAVFILAAILKRIIQAINSSYHIR